jgi:hypothetical protein
VQSVRFVGDLGYVVTFRQTDLGVGREVDPSTARDQGLKVSLFDVSDPAAMVEVDRFVVPGASSAISGDHKAFTWDAARSQAIVPIEHGCGSGPGVTGDCSYIGGAAEVVAVRDGRLVRSAQLTHEADGLRLAPLRSLLVGGDLWTLSSVGLGRSAADAPAGVELLPY